MNPLRLKIENFMNHRLSEVDFRSFRSALIIAKSLHNDRESNGIGKTTFLNAIDYAIFGKVPTSVVERIVRDGADKCLIEYDFELLNDVYRIVRGRSSKNKPELMFYQLIDGEFVSISGRSISETETKIAELIKISYKAFTYAVKFAQRDLTGISSAEDGSERKIMLKEPLQLAAYTKLAKIADGKLKDIKKEIEKVDVSIKTLGDPAALIKAAESELAFHQTNINKKTESLEKNHTIVEQKKVTLAGLKAQLSPSDSDIHVKLSELESHVKKTKNSLQAVCKSVEDTKASIERDNLEFAQLNDKLQIERGKLSNLEEKEARSKDDISKQLNKVSDDELYGTKLLAKLEAEFDAANKRLPNGSVCPVCYQEITEEHRKAYEAEINKLLEETSAKIETTKANLKRCQNKKNKLTIELEEAREHEKELTRAQQEIKSFSSRIDMSAKHAEESQTRLVALTSDMQKLQIEYDESLSRFNNMKETARSNSNNDSLNTQIIQLNDEITVYEKAVQKLQQDLADEKAKRDVANERIRVGNENLEKVKTLAENLNTLNYKFKIHQIVLDAFNPSGIPTFIIYSIIDELQIQGNKWLERLRPELRFSFDKDLEIYYTVNGKSRFDDQLSVGQKVYIALALKLGLSDIIQHRLGVDIRFLELDEVDSALDEVGVEALVDVIRSLQNEYKIFIVTHNNSLLSNPVFGAVITIEGDTDNGACAYLGTN